MKEGGDAGVRVDVDLTCHVPKRGPIRGARRTAPNPLPTIVIDVSVGVIVAGPEMLRVTDFPFALNSAASGPDTIVRPSVNVFAV